MSDTKDDYKLLAECRKKRRRCERGSGHKYEQSQTSREYICSECGLTVFKLPEERKSR